MGFGRLSPAQRALVDEWMPGAEVVADLSWNQRRDPRHASHWLPMRLREAIGTAAWAHQVGDVAFEAHGHRMIADALAEFED